MKALVIAENADAARELCAGARTLADEVVLVTLADAPEGVADKVARVEVPAGHAADDAADTVIAVFDAQAPQVVLAQASRHVKTIVGRLAWHAGTAAITDVTAITAEGGASLYFGGVGERVQAAQGPVAVYTVAPGTFAEAAPSGANEPLEAAWVEPARALRVTASAPVEKSGVDLTKATAVVAAGRGFTEEGQPDLARALCDKTGAGLACSRPLTEGVNWLPSELYVGVSGLMLSPKAYVAVGISGQMQHMVGCNRSQVVFAINKDKNAPVFKQCDYGLVGDLKTVLPALTAAL